MNIYENYNINKEKNFVFFDIKEGKETLDEKIKSYYNEKEIFFSFEIIKEIIKKIQKKNRNYIFRKI